MRSSMTRAAVDTMEYSLFELQILGGKIGGIVGRIIAAVLLGMFVGTETFRRS